MCVHISIAIMSMCECVYVCKNNLKRGHEFEGEQGEEGHMGRAGRRKGGEKTL